MTPPRFIALTLFSCHRDGQGTQPLYQENTVLIRAPTEDEARKIAERHARAEATTYKNAQGETVTWVFERIVDIAPVLDEDLSQDCVDLYTRHFRDRDGYEALNTIP